MGEEDDEDIGDPDALAVVNRVGGVVVAVCNANIHSASATGLCFP